MEVATQRAYVMALTAFGAKLFDRPALSRDPSPWRCSLSCCSSRGPVVSPGFQMSFAASASLIALYEIWPSSTARTSRGVLSRIGPWIIGTAATSLVASFATMPFALYHFDRAALFSVIANIISTPIIRSGLRRRPPLPRLRRRSASKSRSWHCSARASKLYSPSPTGPSMYRPSSTCRG